MWKTQQQRANDLAELCNDNNHKLNDKLAAVKFDCLNQSMPTGVQSVNKAIVASIKNRWNIRENGRKHVPTL